MTYTEDQIEALRLIHEFYAEALEEGGHPFAATLREIQTSPTLTTDPPFKAPAATVLLKVDGVDRPVLAGEGSKFIGVDDAVIQIISRRDFEALFAYDTPTGSFKSRDDDRVFHSDSYGVVRQLDQAVVHMLGMDKR